MKKITAVFLTLLLAISSVNFGTAFAKEQSNQNKNDDNKLSPFLEDYSCSSDAVEPNDTVNFLIHITDANLTKNITTKNAYVTISEDSNFTGKVNKDVFTQSELSFDDKKQGVEIELNLKNMKYIGEGHRLKFTYTLGNGYSNFISFDVMETMGNKNRNNNDNDANKLQDDRVRDAQVWLNQTYSGHAGYTPVEETGIPGTLTSQALVEGLQIELGLPTVTGVFGDQTKAALDSQVGTLNIGSVDDGHNYVRLLQHALYCKGYNPTAVTGNFQDGTAYAINNLKYDAGFTDTKDPAVNSMWMKAILNSDAYVLVHKGDARIREIQQNLNRGYCNYCGIMPCDGIYSRDTNKALIFAWQAEEGLDPATATGSFGPTTKKLSPNLPNDSRYSQQTLNDFIALSKYQLYCNKVDGTSNLDFNSKYDGTMVSCVGNFQSFMCLPNTSGYIDVGTTMSLLTSKGDTDRAAAGFDCCTKLDSQKVSALYNAGYRYVGRYLTNVPGGRDKLMDINEYRTISDGGLRVFPIFQQGGEQKEHFNKEQGKIDCDLAIKAAENIFLPQDAIIYFAVDYDFMNSEVTDQVIPYFEGVSEQMGSKGYSSKYRIGVYGARNICTRVSNEAGACSSFVSDMSTGYSGNYGYPMPTNWAFDQFFEYDFSSDLGIDKDAVSGRDQGVKLDTSYSNYDRKAAVAYAGKWYDDFNTNQYKKYKSDCANFVSQCLTAGGMSQNSGWYYNGHPSVEDQHKDFDNEKDDVDVGEAWRMANRQYRFFSTPANGYINGDVKVIHSADEIQGVIDQCNAEGKPLQKGDLLYFSHKGEGEDGVHHASMISYTDGNCIEYTAHTDPQFNENIAGHLDIDDIYIIRIQDK